MRKLVRFYGEMTRSSDLEVIAIVDEENWLLIRKAIDEGIKLCLGEIAGKHSEVFWVLEEKEISILSEFETEIALFEKWFPCKNVGSFNLVWEVRRAVLNEE